MPKGLLVDVMGTDCTNNGVTSGKSRAILVLSDCQVFESSEDAPALKIEIGYKGRILAVPYDSEIGKGKCGGMFGGHFIYTSDSRFPHDYPIPVHDRFETWQEYEHYSR